MFQIQLFLSSNERLACRSNPHPNIFPLKSPKHIQKKTWTKTFFLAPVDIYSGSRCLPVCCCVYTLSKVINEHDPERIQKKCLKFVHHSVPFRFSWYKKLIHSGRILGTHSVTSIGRYLDTFKNKVSLRMDQ